MTRKLFYILFLLISAISMSAQSNVALDANMHVVFETAGQKEYRTVQYALFKTATKAESVMQQLQAALAAQRGDNGSVELDVVRDRTLGPPLENNPEIPPVIES